MEEQYITEAPFSIQEPADLGRVASVIEGLLERNLIEETITRFSRLRSRDQADVIVRLSPDLQSLLLEQLTPQNVAVIIEELEPEEAVELSQDLEPDQLSQVLDATSPDVAADVLRGVPEDISFRTLERMEEAEEVAPLLEYEDDDAGGIMTPEFVALSDAMTVTQAMQFVRRWAEGVTPAPEVISYLFVVDRANVLKGGLNLSQLVLARPLQHLSLLMDTDIISVSTETDQEQCARLMERYDIRSLPVVDDEGKLVGIVQVEEVIDVFEEEATEDMYRMIGVRETEEALGPFWRSVRNRLPWLCVNLGTAMFAGFIVSLFESTMARAAVLAIFLPVIAGQGGIAGTQTLTLIVRSIALGHVSSGNTRQLLFKEIGLGLVHGAALGALVGVIAFIWKGSEYLALVVALAMASNLIVAGVSGVLVPLGFKALRIDPALASAVAVTTMTDVVGFLVYLSLAALAISLIVTSL